MRFRALNKLKADLEGYFWLPCPACGQMFGGHEWKSSEYDSIPTDDTGRSAEGICPDCGKLWMRTGFLNI